MYALLLLPCLWGCPPCLFDKHGAVEKARKDFDRSLAGLFFCPYDNCGTYCVTTVTVLGGQMMELLLGLLALFTAWLWWATKTVTGRLEKRIEKLEADLRERTG